MQRVTVRTVKYFICSVIFTTIVISISNEGKSEIKIYAMSRKVIHKNDDKENALKKILKIQNGLDIQLCHLIRKYFLDAPSSKPYNLMEMNIPTDYMLYKRAYPSWVFIRSILLDLFQNSTPGFFVEAGAFDGEFLSNTLVLEKQLKWRGLLVETNRKSYKELLEKHRKSWSTPLCLSTSSKPMETVLKSSCYEETDTLQNRGGSQLIKDLNNETDSSKCFQHVVCVPTISLLQSLNITKVDVFSLDVEGVEVDILKNYPFDEVQVDVWVVEHFFKDLDKELANNKDLDLIQDIEFTEFMESKGYYLLDILCLPMADYVFVRKNSKLFQRLQVPEKFWKRRNICKRKGIIEKVQQNIPAELRDFYHFPDIKFKAV